MTIHTFAVEIQAPDGLSKRELKEFISIAVGAEPGHYPKDDPRFHIKHRRTYSPRKPKPKVTICAQTPTTEQSKPDVCPSLRSRMKLFFGR